MTPQYLQGMTRLVTKGESLCVRSQLGAQLAAVDGQVEAVEGAADDDKAEAADGGGYELREEPGQPDGAVGQEEAEEAGDVTTPAAREDGGGGRGGVGGEDVHLLTAAGGHGGGLGPRARAEGASTPGREEGSGRDSGVD